MVHEGQGGFSGPPQHGTGGWGGLPPPSPSGPFPPPTPAYFSTPHQVPSGPSASTILSLVCNILALCTCYGSLAAIVGVVLSIVAMSQAATNPDSARKLTIGSWICFGVAVVFLVLMVMFYFLYGVMVFSITDDSYSYSYSY